MWVRIPPRLAIMENPMHFKQYRPAFFDPFADWPELEEGHAATMAELHAVPFVARWMSEPEFRRLSVSSGRYLMAEVGQNHWVIAYVDDALAELPEWGG